MASCTIKGSLKGLYSYYDKTKSENPDLFLKPIQKDLVCQYTYESVKGKIVVINGLDLKKCLAKKGNSLIYIWGPKCTSKLCFPLEVVQNYCDEKNIDLYIVAEYYDSELMMVSHNIKRPIFGIDTKHYKTSLTRKYINLFLNDMDISTVNEERYLYIKDGIFLKSAESIYDL